MNKFDKATSSTYQEYVGDGYYVTVQYCEFVDADGQCCDKFLGYQYPSLYCSEHSK